MLVFSYVCLYVRVSCGPLRGEDLYGGVCFLMASDSSAEFVLQQKGPRAMKRRCTHRDATCSDL